MQRKSFGLTALIAFPGLFYGPIFATLLLLAPAKPVTATCSSVVSLAIDGDIQVDGYTEEQLKKPQRSWAPVRHRSCPARVR